MLNIFRTIFGIVKIPFVVPSRVSRVYFANKLMLNVIMCTFILVAPAFILGLVLKFNLGIDLGVFPNNEVLKTYFDLPFNAIYGGLFLLALCFIINILRLYISRLHDMNCSGFWILLGFIPIVGIILKIFIFTASGTNGSNKFGEQPASSSKLKCVLGVINGIVLLIAFIFGWAVSIASYS